MLIEPAGTFLTEEDVKNDLGVPVLGLIPAIQEEGLRLIRDTSTFSPLTESYRWLRTNLYFISEQPLRSVLITSALPAEGKSTAAANLAMSLARDGKRVVLVDADLRRPVQHAIFKMNSLPGLGDFLAGTHVLETILHPTPIPNVQVILGGTPSLNPTEMLGTGAFARLLAELKPLCDVVVVDSSPELAVADTMILSSLVDTVLMVIAHGETEKAQTVHAMEYLFRAKAKVLGAVFSRVRPTDIEFYYGKYYVPSETASSVDTVSEAIAADNLLHRRN